MKATEITIEDNGQDFLRFYVNEKGVVIDVQPFGNQFYQGAFVPVSDKTMMQVGKLFPIHHPPHHQFGYLRHKIERIEQVDYQPKTDKNDTN